MSLAGDLDLVVGDTDGELVYIENTGTSTAPVFVKRTGSANPFDGIAFGSAYPTLADIDSDGDLDLISSNSIYFENTGTSTTPVFVQREGEDNPFDGLGSGSLELADLDGDGTLKQCP